MNNPFDYEPDDACRAAFEKLLAMIECLKSSNIPEDVNLCRELEKGKMLGVMIARDKTGFDHALFAFSGQIGDSGFNHRDFVGPVFDYLDPDGYFKRKEREISELNERIDHYLSVEYSTANTEYSKTKELADNEITVFKNKCKRAKELRQQKRLMTVLTEEELVSMVRQSQFEKAELKRIKKRWSDRLKPYEDKLRAVRTRLDELKDLRRSKSESLQQWLFENFRLLNARGEKKSLSEIFAVTPFKVPPSGAGECCAPKLLQSAYIRGWQPLSIAEFWYGKPKDGEVRIQGHHYPACRGKCLPILTWMLEGLTLERPLMSMSAARKAFTPEIIFENEWFCVVDKPSGMLSVPGKGPDISLEEWLTVKYGPEQNVKVAHRLDQDTSGLIVAAFGDIAYRVLQSLFASRQTKKTYIALLEGDYRELNKPKAGTIELPLSPDWLDRPRQRIDYEKGKTAITDYEFLEAIEGRSKIRMLPRTGRTHQLRVHASAEAGLGMPIVGDRLYGKGVGHDGDRLMLHAHKLEFTFPPDRQSYCFESPVPF